MFMGFYCKRLNGFSMMKESDLGYFDKVLVVLAVIQLGLPPMPLELQ